MRELKLSGGKIEVYESIREWPQLRKHELGKLSMLDAQVGDSMDSVGKHFSEWNKFVTIGDFDAANSEAKNLSNNFFYMLSGISIDSYAFVTYIHSINGERYTDLSTSGAEKALKKLKLMGLKAGMVSDQLEELKKKLTTNYEASFLIDMEDLEEAM